jgi:phytoene dehydrogenase-like protein
VSRHDVIVAGAGHNGLVCAALLARQGLDVVVVERRERPGGILDGLVDTVGGLHAGLADELGLSGHGLRLLHPAIRMLALREDAQPIAFWADAARTAEGLAAVSPADAEAYPRYDSHVRALAGFMAELAEVTPPRLDRLSARDAGSGVRLARAYRALGERAGRELTRALPMAAADFVSEWLEADAVRGPLAALGCRHTAMGPWSAGTASVMLAAAAQGAGAPGETVFAAGGPGALADALAAAAIAAGARIRTGQAVSRVLVAGDAVTGVELESGERLEAAAVASAVDPKTVLTRWLDPGVAGPQLRWRAGNIRTPGGAATVELELSALPEFAGVDDPALLEGRITVAPGVDAVERAFDAWKYGQVSERPYLEAVIPTVLEPPANGSGHRMRVRAQWVPFADGLGEQVVERTVAELERHAAGFGGLVTAGRAVTPWDMQRDFGLPGGHLLHAEPGLDQLFAWRPVIGLARYRLGIPGLYLCGSGAHPGGGVSGLPGRNCARELARDLGKGR